MMPIASILLLLAFQTTTTNQQKPYSSQRQPVHSWDIWMASPEANAEAQKSLGHCGDAENQAAMNACSKLEFQAADAKLNEDYREYLPKMDAEARSTLQRIERIWLQYRDLQCKADAAQFEGGSLQPTEFYACMATVTRQRISVMKSAYEDLGR